MIKKQWLEEEIIWLINNYPTKTREECSIFLNKTIGSIRAKASLLNLKKIINHLTLKFKNIWTEEKNNFLIENYKKLGPTCCSKQLNIKIYSVRRRAKQLNLKYAPSESLKDNHKICSKCRIEKELKDFYLKDQKRKIAARCISCIKANDNERSQKESHLIHRKEWYIKNKNRINKERRKNQKIIYKNKYTNNIDYKLTNILRGRLRGALKNNLKSKRTLELLGCTVQFLKQHLEKQFKEGMTWDNHSFYGWHIDHIKPCHTFDLTKEEEQQKCFHYTNLRPLWAKENLARKENRKIKQNDLI